ncbi:helix-turn-helix domain-containing protein [Streptomyces sp. NPDC088812]|uniref:helix-turn-helix domain-containing protein n=1 Tax=Streptomyces sp. NPDC088812 TaxID=3365905 RepID=UPI003801BCB7
MPTPSSPRWSPLPCGLGSMLRRARRRAGFSREGLAAVVRVSCGQLQAIEEEQRPPSVEVAERVSEALRLDPWEDAVLLAVAVDTGRLRTRRGVRHVHRRGAPLPPWVRDRIAVEREAGRSWRAIADGLNATGTPTLQGGSWWASSVRNAADQQTPKG